MNEDVDDWPAALEPGDDNRVLRHRAADRQDGLGTIDYAEAVATRGTAWWAAQSDYEYAYALLRALESACARGAPLHLARCAHHLHDLLSGLDPADRTWALLLLRRIQDLLARRTGHGGAAIALPPLLAYLSAVCADPRFAPPPALPLGLLHRMYARGVSPAVLQETLDRQRYPRGKPLPVCPLCERDRADPNDPLVQALAALPRERREVLAHLGQALALDGDAPDLADQLAWVTGVSPVPAHYQAVVARAHRGGDDAPDQAPDASAET